MTEPDFPKRPYFSRNKLPDYSACTFSAIGRYEQQISQFSHKALMGTSSVASCAALLLAVAPRAETASSGNVGLCNPHGWCPPNPLLGPAAPKRPIEIAIARIGKLQKRTSPSLLPRHSACPSIHRYHITSPGPTRRIRFVLTFGPSPSCKKN